MADAGTLSYLPLSLATALFFVLLLLLTKSRRERGLRLPPSPPSLPVIGHLHLFKKPLHRALANLAAAHGPVLLLRFGSRRVLHITDPAAAEECLTAHDVVFANRPRLPSARHLSNGYTTLGSSSYGANWRNLRRIATVEVLSAGSLLRSAAVRGDEVRLAARRLFLEAAADGASEPSPARADVKARAFELALNVVARMIAGKRYYGGEGDVPESEAEEAARFRKMVREYFAMHGASNLQDFLPVLGVLDIGGARRRAVRLARKRNEWAQRLIDEHRASFDDGKGKSRGGRTMVGDLLDMQAADPEAYSDKVIRALCLSILQTGTDTSSSTIEWGMAELLNHPNAMAKARVELDEVVGTGRLMEEADLPSLPYLQCIITEILRLHPIAPLLAPHESSAACSIAGYDIPAGTMLLVNIHTMHRDARVWEEPARFSPERFEGGRGEGKWMLPFGMGRRGCPGEALGVKMVGLALGTLVQCFEWRRVGDEEVDMAEGSGLTMPMAVPLEALYWPRAEMTPVLRAL
ncbi:cytochrome P450 81Q32-like [Triticum urartu]|uniref:Isoflavone 2'-hydroxylase n=1 Tax=Triticum urartu TaxID=4572 RepID=A0A8R7P9R5_TRIUA|nr:cytochrome P450 81Q32-like [Triticum urartu]